MSIPTAYFEHPCTTYKQAVVQKFSALGFKTRNILVLYGSPEVSWHVNRDLYQSVTRESIPTIRLDANGLRTEGKQASIECLLDLRRQLKNRDIDFSAFDYALWLYLSERYFYMPLDSLSYQKRLKKTDRLGTITGKVSPYSGIIGSSKDLNKQELFKDVGIERVSSLTLELIKSTLPELLEVVEAGLSLNSFLEKMNWFALRLNQRARQWWMERGSEDLKELKDNSLSPSDISQYLPLFLARSLKRHYHQSKLPPNKQKLVIFIDGYEALETNPETQQCLWLEEMMDHSEASPYILWVITTDKKLNWMEDAEQHPILPLTNPETNQILQDHEIEDPVHREKMIDLSLGNPQYLNAILCSWYEHHRITDKPYNFPASILEILGNQTDIWGSRLYKLYQVLSVPNFWDAQILEALSEIAGIPLSESQNIISDSPYIEALGDEKASLNPLWKEYLHTHIDAVLSNEIHQRLFEIYQQRIESYTGLSSDIQLVTHHALFSANVDDNIEWVLKRILLEQEAQHHQEVIPALVDITDSQGVSETLKTRAYLYLGESYIATREFQLAIEVLETARSQWEILELDDGLDAAEIEYLLSEGYLRTQRIYDANNAALKSLTLRQAKLEDSDLAIAESAMQLALVAQQQNTSKKHQEANQYSELSLNVIEKQAVVPRLQLAQYQYFSSQIVSTPHTLDAATHLCQQALQNLESIGKHETYLAIECHCLLGNQMVQMGERHLSEAFNQFIIASELAEQLLGPTHVFTKSIIQARIGILKHVGQNEDASELETQLADYELIQVHKDSLDLANALNRRGYSLYNKGNYGQAEPLYLQALKMTQKLLGIEHPNVFLILNNLAELYRSQGRYEEAEPLYLQALKMAQKLLGIEHPNVALSLNNLAELYRSQGRYKEAEPLYLQALKMAQKLLGIEHPYVALSLNNLAELYDNQGRYEEAETVLVQALEMRQKLLGHEHPDIASSLTALASFYHSQGRYEEAETKHKQALEMYQKLLGQEHHNVATSLNNLALLNKDQGRYEEAETKHKHALEIYQKLLGHEHPDIACNLNNLATLYFLQGRYTEAEPLFTQALKMRQKLLGHEHPSVAINLSTLGSFYHKQGRYEEAETKHKQALQMRQKLLGTEHPSVATSLNNLASLYADQGRYEEAEPLYVQDLEITQKLLGYEHPDVATSLYNLATLYKEQGRYEEAETKHKQALQMRQKLLGTEHPDIASSLNNLATLYRNQRRYEEAEPLYGQALEMRQKLLGYEHPDIATSLYNLATLYFLQGRYTEAEPLCTQTLKMYQKLLGNEHPDIAMSLNNLATLYSNQGRYTEAEPLYVQALEMYQKLLGNEHPDVANSMWFLGALHQKLARNEDAEDLYRKALVIFEKKLGSSHPSTLSLRKDLASLP